mmetsp:Transcript_36885/g.73572  ORF Transcript_36885/g.73572 Transcript_36885/m.73572 type:complete len:86 (+) Transcript_36885:2404-2661(+)
MGAIKPSVERSRKRCTAKVRRDQVKKVVHVVKKVTSSSMADTVVSKHTQLDYRGKCQARHKEACPLETRASHSTGNGGLRTWTHV